MLEFILGLIVLMILWPVFVLLPYAIFNYIEEHIEKMHENTANSNNNKSVNDND